LFTKYFIDHILPKKEIEMLLISVIVLIFLILIRAVIQYSATYLNAYIGEFIGKDIKNTLYEHIVHLPISYFNENSSGYISSRILQDASTVQNLVTYPLSNLLRNGLMFLVGIITIFLLSWKLSLAAIISLPFYIYFNYVYSKSIREGSKKVAETNAQLWGFLSENCLSVKLMKEFQMERWGKHKFFKNLKIYIKETLILDSIRYKFISVASAIKGTVPVIVLGYGGYLVMNNSITLGTLVAFSAFVSYIFEPVYSLITLNQMIQEGMASFLRIKEIQALETENIEGEKFSMKGDIIIKDLSFSRNGRKILDRVNLKIKEHEKVLLKGKSGEGKTTLLNLLFRHYNYSEGEIFIGEKELKNLNLKSLRNNIGYLSQEVFLFRGTLKENLILNMNVEDGF